MKNLFFIVCLMLFGGITIAQNDNNRETKVEPTETDVDRDFENYLARYAHSVNSIAKSRSNSSTKKAEVLRMAEAIIQKYGHQIDRDNRPIESRTGSLPYERDETRDDTRDGSGGGGSIVEGEHQEDGESLELTYSHNTERIRRYFNELQRANKNRPVLSDYAMRSVGELKDRDFAMAVAIYRQVGVENIAPQDLCRGNTCDTNDQENGRIRGGWVYEGKMKFFMESDIWGKRFYSSYINAASGQEEKVFGWKRAVNVKDWGEY